MTALKRTNKKHIIECEKNLLLAMRNSDVRALDELLHEDLLFNDPGGNTVTKAKDLEIHRSGVISFSEMQSEEPMINLIEDIAVVSVIIELQGKYLDQPIEGKLRYTRVWKLFGDSCKVVAGSCVNMP